MTSKTACKPSATLEELAASFEEWRASRPYRRAPVPDELRRQALDLLADHTPNQVCARLGINGHMLKKWRARFEQAPEPAAFVPLEIPAPPADETPTVRVCFSYADGVRATLEGELSPAQLTALVRGLQPGQEAQQ